MSRYSWRELYISTILSNLSNTLTIAIGAFWFLVIYIPFSYCRFSTTTLSYEVNVIPRFNFPAIFLERIIISDLPVNLQALACRSESDFEGNQNLLISQRSLSASSLDSLPLQSVEINGTTALNKHSAGEIEGKIVKATFGPLSPPTRELNNNWGIFGKACQLDRPCLVDEVHLRRFDGLLVTD